MKRVSPLAQAVTLRPVGERQPKKLADHRKRQPSRIAVDEISGASVGKQLIGQFASDRQNARLRFKHGLPTKRFVDDASQAGVIRLIGRQNVVGNRAHDLRHPPLKSDDVAAVPAQSECLAVSQHLVGTSCVVVVQTVPMSGNRTSTTEPAAFSITALVLRKYS